MNALVKNHRRSFAYVLIGLLLQVSSWAQVTANFTASPPSGCSPLVVHFTDQSTGNPTQWKWNLGNGVISTLQNPSATYFNPGTYTISLLAKNATGADSIIKSQLVTVYANPVVSFAASDTAGCFPLFIQFTDASLAGSGHITGWQWDFGDGTISTLQNPSHIYTSAGLYNVTLKVTNSFGCVKTLTKTKYITISNGVQSGFNVNAKTFCAAPAHVVFTNTSTGSGNSFTWHFGDGTTSNEANPVHTYTAAGSFSVKLVTVSPQGCRDTLVKSNLIYAGAQSSFIAPATACVNQPVSFTNNSSPTPISVTWRFSDGTMQISPNVVKKFSNAGSFTVTMINDYGTCKDTVKKQVIIVGKPKAGFDATKKLFCQAPSMVSFQSSSTGAVSWLWNFGDGSTSTETNPVHQYQNFGNFDVSLVVTNASGCTDTLKRNQFIKIQKPGITLSGLPATGCVPLTVNPTATILTAEPIQSYYWNFGDGTTSTDIDPQHVYTTAGNYDLTLVITTVGGCTDSVKMVDAVRTGNKPIADFNVLNPEVCNVNPVYFSDNSSGNVDQWLWMFGDSLSSAQQNPAHVFDNIGRFDVMLIVWSNTCADTILKEDVANVLPPLAQFDMGPRSCTDKYTIELQDYSVGATHVLWDFGDGSTSTTRNLSHTYASPGVYKVVYKAFNDSCWNMNHRYIRIIDEKANLVADNDTVCRSSSIHFSTPGVIDSNIVSWNWDFGDGQFATAASSVDHIYSQPGIYQVVLTIEDLNGCMDQDTMQIVVHGPTASFTTPVTTTCLSNNLVPFHNTSITDGVHPIVQYTWNFGDGTSETVNSPYMQHQYQAGGIFTVSLTVTDQNGCSDTYVHDSKIIVSQPVADFLAADTISCTGQNIVFNNLSIASLPTYLWSFGDGGVSASKSPDHAYGQTGIYTIQLVVTDQYGCIDSVIKNDYLAISLPKAKFTLSDSVGNCPPLMVNFTNQSTGYTSLKWYFGDGNSSMLEHPSHFYNTPGTFYAKLVATGPGGCTDSAFQKIVVKGPNGSFTYTPLSGCNPLSVNFTATTENTTSFVWDFSDGVTIAGHQSFTSHTYEVAGAFIPKIILSDASGCQYPVVGTDTIRVYEIEAGFTMSADSFCKAGTVYFNNTTISNDQVVGYSWDFGDGSTGADVNPSHYYHVPGRYTVQLTAWTKHGCSDVFILRDTITILPAPSISIEGQLEACVPAVFSFAGKNENQMNPLSWQWNFGNGTQANVQNPFFQNYASAGDYTVTAIATAANGCSDTAINNITVHPLPHVNAGIDLDLCQGDSVQLLASGAQSYSWSADATLSCTDCASPSASPGYSTLYVVTGENEFGCKQADSVMVTVQQPFELQVEPGDTICIGSMVHLRAGGADLYSWLPSTGVANAYAANTTARPTISTNYTVVGTDRKNCFTDTASVFIKVWPIPTVDAGLDQSLVVGNALQLNANSSADVSSWQWSQAGTLSCASCPVTLAKPAQTTTYRVVVKNDGGCTASDDVTVRVICNNGNLFVPNTFSPNGDGVNDRFYPEGTGINRIKSFRVFNRWGEVVFEKRDFSANEAASGWDGLFKGQSLSPDVYIWNCEVVCMNNEVLSFKGDVTLLR